METKLFSPGHLAQMANALIYAVLGIAILIGVFALVDRLTPYPLWREIVEGHNQALAILVGAMTLAMGIVIAAAIH